MKTQVEESLDLERVSNAESLSNVDLPNTRFIQQYQVYNHQSSEVLTAHLVAGALMLKIPYGDRP